MLNTPDELLIISRTYDLILWTCRHVAAFPRAYRYTLGQRLDDYLNAVSLEQSDKARLLKVMIGGERFGNAVVLHHHERDAIGERPIFVGTSGEECVAASK